MLVIGGQIIFSKGSMPNYYEEVFVEQQIDIAKKIYYHRNILRSILIVKSFFGTFYAKVVQKVKRSGFRFEKVIKIIKLCGKRKSYDNQLD